VHIDLLVVLGALVVGFVVGLTGMGGGALMTPMLVLLFHVQPLAAVSSDLVASLVMKPVGSAVHLRRHTVHKEILPWLMLGSVPSAFAGVLVVKFLLHGSQLQADIKLALGGALLLASAAMALNAWLRTRRLRRDGVAGQLPRRPLVTVLIGVFGGFLVGVTSVGSGSVVIVLLMFLYPQLTGSELVGTVLVQAVPMVGAAALGHVFFGDFQLALTLSLLIGALPGVYLGARLSAVSPDFILRPALVIILLATSLKLLNWDNGHLALALAGAAVLALVLFGRGYLGRFRLRREGLEAVPVSVEAAPGR
jgi:uncharacterized membrane protein YfcA